jgi:hypothetical protein
MKNKTAVNFLVKKAESAGMIKILLVFAALLFFLCGSGEKASAQDLLILKSGKELKVNIIEESPDIVKYREFDNPTGPLFSIGKDKVASIQYKKGSKETVQPQAKEKENIISAGKVTPEQPGAFKPLTYKKRMVKEDGRTLSVRQVKTLMEEYPVALKKYESGKFLGKASNGCAFGVIIVSFAATLKANSIPTKFKTNAEVQSEKMKILVPALAIDGVLLITGIVLASIGRHNIHSAVTIYNSSANKPVTYKLDVGLQDHGVGLALRF